MIKMNDDQPLEAPDKFSPEESSELLKLQLDQKVGLDVFEQSGSSQVYYSDYVVDMKEINFYLYTKKQPGRAQLLKFMNPKSIEKTYWNGKHVTKFYIHGFMSSGTDMLKKLITAYFPEKSDDKKDVNLIIVDWGRYSHTSQLFYMAKFVVPLIGTTVGKMIDALLTHGTTRDKIHLIGHSLGAQICSHASKNVGGNIGRITGLDPAAPGYEGILAFDHLSKKDAKFVDVIHSNMQIFGYGMHSKVGHADFYPNGGSHQKGCYLIDFFSNHQRAVEYFIESVVSTKGFQAKKCNSYRDYKKGNYLSRKWVLMGDGCKPFDKHGEPVEGNFYLTTNGEFPYAKGKEK